MNKRGVIRGLWGSPEESLRGEFAFEKEYTFDKKSNVINRWGRTKKILSLMSVSSQKAQYPCDVMFVFGKDNQKMLSDMGLESVLVWDEPFKFHPVRRHWWHKLFIMEFAMKNGFDELVWMDLDCKMKKPIDNGFWSLLGKKSTFQATLVKYQCKMVHFRDKYTSYVPNGSFVYIGDKSIPSLLLSSDLGTWTDEVIYSKYTDDLMGGYDQDAYLKRFEPIVFSSKRSVFKQDKDLYFSHY